MDTLIILYLLSIHLLKGHKENEKEVVYPQVHRCLLYKTVANKIQESEAQNKFLRLLLWTEMLLLSQCYITHEP